MRVIKAGDAKELDLPGRKSLEIISEETGSAAMTLRLVEIPVRQAGEALREMHRHDGFEECMYVLSGCGTTYTENSETPVEAGDSILVAPGELHVTRNTGNTPLQMLCFFPIAQISRK